MATIRYFAGNPWFSDNPKKNAMNNSRIYTWNPNDLIGEKALFWGLTFKKRGRLGSRSAYSIIYQYLMIHPPSIPWQKGNCPYKPSESIVLKGAFYYQLMTFSSNVFVEKEMQQWASFRIMIFSFHQFVYGKICWGLRKVCSSRWWRLMKVPYNINKDDGFLTVRVFKHATTDGMIQSHPKKTSNTHTTVLSASSLILKLSIFYLVWQWET